MAPRDRLGVCVFKLSRQPKFGSTPPRRRCLRAEPARPCIVPMAASDPHNHDASLSDAAENLGPRSLSYAHRGLRVSFYVYNVLPVNLSLPLTKEFWSDPIR